MSNYRASNTKNQARVKKTRRVATSFLQAAEWSAAERSQTHPTKNRDVIAFRQHLLKLAKWADDIALKCKTDGCPRLIIAEFEDQLEASLATECLEKAFGWYKIELPSLAFSIGVSK